MAPDPITATPRASAYDVIIVGGAIYGSAVAWFLTDNPDFDGTILVVERDPTYEFCSTSRTNSCMRQQFSSEINVRVSQFAADFVKNLRSYMGGDQRIPQLTIRNFGYLYLADTEAFAETLRRSHAVQVAAGAGTRLLTPDDIAKAYPFYNLDGIVLGSHNQVDEGYWDGITVFDWWRRQARERGAEYLHNEIVAIARSADGRRVDSVTLGTGETIACGTLVNASGPRAAETARMAGLDIPVEPRKRFSYVFTAEQPLDRDLPLTIEPSGVHMRQDGRDTYLAGCAPDDDSAVAYDDFEMDHDLWLEKVWPAIAGRVPQFEAIRVTSEWAGHYAYNVFDHNAILGPHTDVSNFIFVNGFSGHGLQQSPAMGRGIAELIAHGEYRSLDLSPFNYDRIPRGEPFVETAVI